MNRSFYFFKLFYIIVWFIYFVFITLLFSFTLSILYYLCEPMKGWNTYDKL